MRWENVDKFSSKIEGLNSNYYVYFLRFKQVLHKNACEILTLSFGGVKFRGLAVGVIINFYPFGGK
jgi:hypothetical protein